MLVQVGHSGVNSTYAGCSASVGLDIDADAVKVVAQNARLNKLENRLKLMIGGSDARRPPARLWSPTYSLLPWW
jgi:ribosomal protein L11 methylase PrmA